MVLTMLISLCACSNEKPITELNFACKYKDSLYLCGQNQILKFSNDLSSKEVVYTYNIDNGFYISDFLFFDDNTLYIRLTDDEETPAVKLVKVDLKSKKSDPLYKESQDFIYGVPFLIGKNTFCSRAKKEDFSFSRPSLIRLDTNGNETVILKDIYYYSFDNSRIYYMTESDSKTIYSCNFDGGDVKKVLATEKELISFEVYNNRIYYDLNQNADVYVYDISAQKTVNLGSSFYRSALFFNGKFAFASEKDGKNLLRIDTGDYSITKIQQTADNWSYCVIDDWIYMKSVASQSNETVIYRMKTDGTLLEKII